MSITIISSAKKGILIRHVLVAIHIYLNLLAVATIAASKLIAPTSPLKQRKMEDKYRIRKTGEIVEVISWGGSTTRSDVLDFVSYIDSKGVEHEKESLNLYWDLEPVKERQEDFDHLLEMNTEAERRKIAAMAMQGLLANPDYENRSSRDVASRSVIYADALIAELNKKKDGS